MPVLAAAEVHRVAHLGALGMAQPAQVAALRQRHLPQRVAPRAAHRHLDEAAPVPLVAVQHDLGAGGVGHQGERPIAGEVRGAPLPDRVPLGEGLDVPAEEHLRLERLPRLAVGLGRGVPCTVLLGQRRRGPREAPARG